MYDEESIRRPYAREEIERKLDQVGQSLSLKRPSQRKRTCPPASRSEPPPPPATWGLLVLLVILLGPACIGGRA